MAATAPPASPPAAPESGSAPVSARPADLWRRARGPIAALLGLAVVAVLVSIGAQRPPEGVLEPEGPNPEGARALVQILEGQGADVTIARDAAAAADALTDRSVLVLAFSHRLTAEQLDDLARAPGDRLLVQPSGPALDALAPGVEVAARADAGTLDPGCDLPAVRAAGPADLGGELYSAPGGDGCYPAADDGDLGGGGETGGDALVRVTADSSATMTVIGTGATTVIGTGAPLTNEHLADEGNAALALNLIDGRDVVWLLPDVAVPEGQASLPELLPLSLRYAVLPLGAALLLLAFWQGRRLGPLVTERLPVVVRASETTEGRAGLYAARRARDRAGAALREGLIGRVRPALGLGPDAAPETVVDALAQRTGGDPAALGALLYGPREGAGADAYTADDDGLVRLADDLDRLESRLR
ncbi:DUF4350 domain-containing protein [Nocardiopsis mangrovi]|uniref:DUF4350 domain-containing protein n=1 Tax=Nocardiopsis mangrovi TaxID=1179818 RepID=A0ABV9DUJ9_9ACTN